VVDGILSPAGELAKRLTELYDGLQEVIRAYAPDAVAMESPFFSKNVVTTLKLGQAQGVIVLAATHSALDAFSYTPMEVKSAVAGYGKATKTQVREMVKRLLGVDAPMSLDASDALAVAICHIHAAGLKRKYHEHLSSQASGR
jgi:crossover junction endodeoxyribonuclease RuvC